MSYHPLRKPSNIVTNRYASSRSLPLAAIIGHYQDLDMMAFYAHLPCKHLGWAWMPSSALGYYLVWKLLMAGKLWEWSLHLWCDFICYHIDKSSEDDHRIDSDCSSGLLFQRGSGIFLAYVGIKNAGFLRNSDWSSYLYSGGKRDR